MCMLLLVSTVGCSGPDLAAAQPVAGSLPHGLAPDLITFGDGGMTKADDPSFVLGPADDTQALYSRNAQTHGRSKRRSSDWCESPWFGAHPA